MTTRKLSCRIGGRSGFWRVGGRQLLRIVPFGWTIRGAAVVMGTLAAVSRIAAITG